MGVTHLQESTELGSILIVTMRSLLVVALFAVARGNPQFVYTVGQHRYPYVFTNGHSASYSTPSQPLSYVRPQLYANNACRNHLGELVPCALPSVAGQSVYAYNAVPNTFLFKLLLEWLPFQAKCQMRCHLHLKLLLLLSKPNVRLKLTLMPVLRPMLRLILTTILVPLVPIILTTMVAMPMDILTLNTALGTLENDLLKLNLKQTMVPTDMDILMDILMDTPMDTLMESGLLKLNLKPKLMLILLSTLDTTMLDTMVLTCHTTMEPTMPILTTIMLQL